MKRLFWLVILAFVLCGCGNAEKRESARNEAVYNTEEVNISLVAVGDNLIHSSVYNDAARLAADNPSREYDFKPMFKNVALRLVGADITFWNQETVIGGSDIGLSDYPCFNSPYELGEDMIDLGVDVVNHATNHIFDRGEEGIANAVDFWKKHPEVTVVGINDGTYPEIQYTEVKGIRFAWLGYGYGTNGLSLPEDSRFSVNLIDNDRVVDAAKEARENADIVVVSLHWGNEYQMSPSEEQRELAELLAEGNVDLIIGHHPHVVQPTETIVRPDGKKTVVAYSLGNFVSAQDMANSMLEGMLEVEFSGTAGDMEVSDFEFVPLINHFDAGYRGFVVYPFDMYTPELAASHGVRAFDPVFSYEYMEELIEEIFTEERENE